MREKCPQFNSLCQNLSLELNSYKYRNRKVGMQIMMPLNFPQIFEKKNIFLKIHSPRSLFVFLRSAARRIPSLARMPRQVPACPMASMAYST